MTVTQADDRTDMLAASYCGGEVILVERVATPARPAPGHVVLDVAYVGICGTDLHILHGAMDQRVSMPAVLGHEMSGRVAAVGEGVEGWQVGDPVTVMPLDWDGTCSACLAGYQHICQHLNFVGIDSPGALQERWTVSADWLVAVPEGLDLRDAALAEPTAVAVHDVRRSGLSAGERAVVLGGGPIGLLIAQVAAATGADVVVSEPDAGRRAVLERIGVATVDPTAVDVVGWVESWTDGSGAEVVFEVSGARQAVASTTALAARRGRVVVVAIHPKPVEVDLQQVFWKELSLLGARVYTRADFDRALALLASGVIAADTVISRVVPLQRADEAFALLGRGDAMKVLVSCEGSGR